MRQVGMNFRNAMVALAAVLALGSAAPALAQSDDAPVQPSEPAPNLTPPPPEAVPSPESQPPPDDEGQAPDDDDDGYAQPPPQAEYQTPAPPPQVTVTAGPGLDGQWVFTGQYGWVWMPYAQSYTYVVPGGDPFMFVYSVGFGWRWVTAPWVYGWGPRPYWGFHGPRYFYWHRHPWFHAPRYHVIAPLRFSYHPVYRTRGYYRQGSGYHGVTRTYGGGFGYHGARPPTYHGGPPPTYHGAQQPGYHGTPPPAYHGAQPPAYHGAGRGWSSHPSAPPPSVHPSAPQGHGERGGEHGGHGGGHWR